MSEIEALPVDVDPLVVAQARIAALEASEATLQRRVQEVEQQHSAMQQALDAERSARPATLEEVLSQIKGVFLDALAEHGTTQVGELLSTETEAPGPIARGIVP